MGIKIYKPTSPGRRGMTGFDFAEITKSRPEKSLVKGKLQRAGRNSQGRITTRFHGSGHKRRYRIIDFKRDKTGIPARITAIEYDPNRTCRIALLCYADGEKRYILCPDKLNVGDTVVSAATADMAAAFRARASAPSAAPSGTNRKPLIRPIYSPSTWMAPSSSTVDINSSFWARRFISTLVRRSIKRCVSRSCKASDSLSSISLA